MGREEGMNYRETQTFTSGRNGLYLDYGDVVMVLWVYTDVKTNQTVCLKCVQFIVLQ